MSGEPVKVRARSGGGGSRCPYCHDLLSEESPGEGRVDCAGCGTSHHLACLTELGRCTVMGCDRAVDEAFLQDRPPASSRVQRLIRQRQRDRARRFVRRHAQVADSSLREARLAPREGGWGRGARTKKAIWEDSFGRGLLMFPLVVAAVAGAVAVLIALLD